MSSPYGTSVASGEVLTNFRHEIGQAMRTLQAARAIVANQVPLFEDALLHIDTDEAYDLTLQLNAALSSMIVALTPEETETTHVSGNSGEEVLLPLDANGRRWFHGQLLTDYEIGRRKGIQPPVLDAMQSVD